MPVRIRKMTDGEYRFFYQWSLENHTAELAEETGASPEKAREEAAAELAGMLPDGPDTEGHYLMTVAESGGVPVGFLWMLHEETDGRKQCFLCDFAIREPFRRKGFGTAALALARSHAMESGCVEGVLFVRDDNIPAKALYEKCGYRILRQHGCGAYMIQQFH